MDLNNRKMKNPPPSLGHAQIKLETNVINKGFNAVLKSSSLPWSCTD